MRQLIEELLELAGALALVLGVAWAVGVAVPSPWSWPAGAVTGGLGLLLLGQWVYFARTARRGGGGG